MYDLRKLVHLAAMQHRTIVSPQIPLFTVHASLEAPLCDVYTTPRPLLELEELEATLTCYSSVKT